MKRSLFDKPSDFQVQKKAPFLYPTYKGPKCILWLKGAFFEILLKSRFSEIQREPLTLKNPSFSKIENE